jgi:hypothetical protein
MKKLSNTISMSILDGPFVWPQQCSACRSGAFQFARLVPCCDVLYDIQVKSMFDSGHVFFMSFVFILVSNTISCDAGSAHPSGAPRLFSGVHAVLSLVFCIMFYGLLFFLSWFFACPVCCMSFFVLRLLITPFVSSSCSHLNMWCSPSTKINKVST